MQIINKIIDNAIAYSSVIEDKDRITVRVPQLGKFSVTRTSPTSYDGLPEDTTTKGILLAILRDYNQTKNH